MKCQTVLSHQVRDYRRSRPADSCITVDEDAAARGKRILHETVHGREVLLEVGCGRVELADPLVGVLLRELGVQARAHRQDVRDAVPIENVLVGGGDLIAKKEPLNDLVQRLDPIVLVVDHL